MFCIPSGCHYRHASQLNYEKVHLRQTDLGKYLTAHYHIRTANELSSCEVCHR